jgi:hypothetical protein
MELLGLEEQHLLLIGREDEFGSLLPASRASSVPEGQGRSRLLRGNYDLEQLLAAVGRPFPGVTLATVPERNHQGYDCNR